MRRMGRTDRDTLWSILIIVAWLAVWQALFHPLNMNPLIVTTPSAMFSSFLKLTLHGSSDPRAPVYANLAFTIHSTIVAFLINIAIGFTLGFLFGFFSYAGKVGEPLVLALQAFPVVVLFPVIVLYAGVSLFGHVILAVLIGLPYLIFNTSNAIRNVNPSYYELGRSIGLSKLASIRKIIIPDAGPLFIEGLRLSFAYTYVGIIVAEIVYVSNGLGYLLFWAGENFYVSDLFAVLLLIVITGIFVDSTFRIIESRLMRWKYM